MSRIAFVTNFCPHYRVRTFETLAKYHDVDYYFFSAGDDWYWQQQHGVRRGSFRFQYLPGWRLAGTRITPTLPFKLWRGGYDAYVKCINGRFALPITYLMARLARRPFILWTGVWMRLGSPAHRLLYPITRYLYRHADAIVVYGEHVKRFLETEGVSSERIFVAHHAVDNLSYNRPVDRSDLTALRRQLAIGDSAKVVLYLGRLEEEKGLEYLLRAFSVIENRDTVLVLAGSGSCKGRLQQVADELGIADRVRFPGYVEPADAPPYYALAWIYVLPSITTPMIKETWGLVINEAFNQGLPVIATESVGAVAGGFVQNGVTGLVVAERDHAALAHAMVMLLDDNSLRERMSERARLAVTVQDNERMVSGFTEAIALVLAGTPPARRPAPRR
jgi:glycosyltransferase involved in cell wall biosynthesis